METKNIYFSKSITHCVLCDYKCCNNFLWKQHTRTAKHIRKHMETYGNNDKSQCINDKSQCINDKSQCINEKSQCSNEKSQCINEKLQCINCEKKFKNRSGLWKHKKICIITKEEDKIIEISNNNNYKDMVFKLITENQEFKNVMFKENQELRKQLIEQQKQMSDMIPLIGNNNNNTNNVKQKFNINVFLNEKCKDALSIDQFIDTIEVSMKNLLTTRDKGLGEGLSSIIIDNMNKLSLYERPMHCTDKKRETMYIKNHKWAKDEKLEHIDKLLKRVENKQIKNIEKWTEANPNFMESEKLQEEYIKLIKGCTSSIDDCRGKAIKNVCDKVYIEKD